MNKKLITFIFLSTDLFAAVTEYQLFTHFIIYSRLCETFLPLLYKTTQKYKSDTYNSGISFPFHIRTTCDVCDDCVKLNSICILRDIASSSLS